MNFIQKIFNKIKNFPEKNRATDSKTNIIGVDNRNFSTRLENYNTDIGLDSEIFTWSLLKSAFDGEKYPTGLAGSIKTIKELNYWKLRQYSYTIYIENKYAQALIKRLVTNVIHTGLTLEADVKNSVLGISDEEVNIITDDIETKFDIFAENKELISYDYSMNFGMLQQLIYLTALLAGDVLIILRQDEKTGLPRIQLIDGLNVRTPPEQLKNEKIRDGIEFDERGRQIGYYIKDKKAKNEYTRIAAFGEKTGRRLAWLVYCQTVKINDTRGMPLLGVLLQSMKDIDRYSDAEQKAAWLNSLLAFFIKKTQDKPSTYPVSRGANKRSIFETIDQEKPEQSRKFNVNKLLPGIIFEELQAGEEPVSFNSTRPNINFAGFEKTIMDSFAWTVGLPPAIFRLIFESNYAASGGELNELKAFLKFERGKFADSFLKIFYQEALISFILAGYINAPGFLLARRENDFIKIGAWLGSNWAGLIKPSLRLLNDIKAYQVANREGYTTRSRAAKDLFNERFNKSMQKLKKENEALIQSLQPLIDAGLLGQPAESSQTE